MTTAEMQAVAEYIDAAVELGILNAMKAHPVPAEPDIDALATAIIARITPPPPGKDGEPGKDAEPIDKDALVAEIVALIPKDVDPDIDVLAATVLARIALPKDGDPGTPGKDAEPVDEDALVERVVALIPKPMDGKDADPVDHLALVERVMALIPKPRDGRDGISEDRLERAVAEMETRVAENVANSITLEGRTLKVGNKVLRTLPVPEYKGAFALGTDYEPGDMVSWAGSMWLCRKATNGKPLEGDAAWVLSAKRGRDGKDK